MLASSHPLIISSFNCFQPLLDLGDVDMLPPGFLALPRRLLVLLRRIRGAGERLEHRHTGSWVKVGSVHFSNARPDGGALFTVRSCKKVFGRHRFPALAVIRTRDRASFARVSPRPSVSTALGWLNGWRQPNDGRQDRTPIGSLRKKSRASALGRSLPLLCSPRSICKRQQLAPYWAHSSE